MVKRGKGEVIVGMIDIKEPLAIRKRGRVGQVAGGREENVRRERLDTQGNTVREHFRGTRKIKRSIRVPDEGLNSGAGDILYSTVQRDRRTRQPACMVGPRNRSPVQILGSQEQNSFTASGAVVNRHQQDTKPGHGEVLRAKCSMRRVGCGGLGQERAIKKKGGVMGESAFFG